MRSVGNWLRRQVACCLVLVLAAPFAECATSAAEQAQAPSSQQGSAQQGSSDTGSQLPASSPPASPSPQTASPQTGTTPSGQAPADASPAATAPATSPDGPAATPTATPQSSGEQGTTPQQRPGDNAPVGSAAAPYEKGVGNAASRPAGAAIAPAKQKRTRSILIRVGILVGAAVAIGTVVGLSESSSSRPN